jgi:hypothetical protein
MAIKKVKIKKQPEWVEKLDPDSTSGTAKKLQDLALTQDVLDLIAAGETSYEKIGQMVHPPISGAKAKRLVEGELTSRHEDMLNIQREKIWYDLHELRKVYWKRAIGYVDDKGVEHEPNQNAAMFCLKQIDKIIGMYGLNAPVEVKHVHVIQEVLAKVKPLVTNEQFSKLLDELIEGGSSEAPGGSPFGTPGGTSGLTN